MQELVNFKVKKEQIIERYFWEENEKLLEIENRAQELNERLFLYLQALMSEPRIFALHEK